MRHGFFLLSAVLALGAGGRDFIRTFRVDGQEVRLGADETQIDFEKIYPGSKAAGRDGTRWAVVEASVESEADRTARLCVDQDWYGSFELNGETFADSFDGSQSVYVDLKKGTNRMKFRSRGGYKSWKFGLSFDTPRKPGVPVATVDFGVARGKLRPELHSSGFGPLICSCPQKTVDIVRSMNLMRARTHDWALINPNQRVCDYFHIFPLMHLDATDPKNYVFGPTDYLLKRTREEAGLDVYYRLGTSIEHSGEKVHFNTLIPTDFDKVAEIFAGTVRHYNHGWADGYKWGIKYWLIWNEPDGVNNMWCLPEGDGPGWGTPETEARSVRRRKSFNEFFVRTLKRLKSEFPNEKFGGPGMCLMREDWFRPLLEACKAAGVAPDFISWHYYGSSVDEILGSVAQGRALCDSLGFRDCELVLDEWHYVASTIDALKTTDEKAQERIWQGPGAHNGTDSAAFALTVLMRFQASALDQAYFYGCRHTGNWGFMDERRRLNKVYYALKAFGAVLKDFTSLGEVGTAGSLTTLVAKSADGRRTALLVSDYKGAAGDIVLSLRAAPAGRPKAVVLDHVRNLEPVDVKLDGNTLTLPHDGPASASYLLTWGECE